MKINYDAFFRYFEGEIDFQAFPNVFLDFEIFAEEIKFLESESFEEKINVLKELFINIFKKLQELKFSKEQYNIILKICEKLFFKTFSENYNLEKSYSLFKKEILIFSCDRMCFFSKKKFDKNEFLNIFDIFYKKFFSKFSFYNHVFGFEINEIFELEEKDRSLNNFKQDENNEENENKENLNLNENKIDEDEEEEEEKEKLIEDILKREKQILDNLITINN